MIAKARRRKEIKMPRLPKSIFRVEDPNILQGQDRPRKENPVWAVAVSVFMPLLKAKAVPKEAGKK